MRAAMIAVLAGALVAGCARHAPEAGEPVAWEAPPATTAAADPTTTPPEPSPTPSAATTPTPKPAPSKSAAAKTTGNWRYVFPVQSGNVSYHPTHSGYPATDVFADCGEPVVAVTDGKVLEVSRVDTYSKSGPQGPDNGGLSVSLLGDDGVRYYGSHMTVVQSGIEAGVRVRAGQRLGTVGKTGNANNVCHLHFGISPVCGRTGDWWIRRGVIWPAPFLDDWRKKKSTSPVSKVASFKASKGCPKEP
ncbi:M23 family metallopeptidase [Phytohabitans sp. ZYX-F-186]|uniref:M23 family metallopeptidase n=1 Tax=Phytohabitans maris TaxID=3071409 RepID=A0ABU0ZKP6_9ACTN|nr:M23 family metallopeptidase [Phytohabitans sp. ZYX-F-186]MDQ7906830.1 M23 family metallopeptidase [Phytohabitans sp. ZYX-F-186]